MEKNGVISLTFSYSSPCVICKMTLQLFAIQHLALMVDLAASLAPRSLANAPLDMKATLVRQVWL